MDQIAGWVAPVATMLAACMTAANLGPRVTGWGFVIFTIGAVAWSAVGLATGQSNLLWQNVFLLAVDVVGVWRWLGREARYGDGAARAAEASEHPRTSTLFPVSLFAGAPVSDAAGGKLGSGVDAMARCADGGLDYFVVRSGGVGGLGETLRAVPWRQVRVAEGEVSLTVDAAGFEALAPIDAECWPERL